MADPPPPTAEDSEGETVAAGDIISFCFGIPPVVDLAVIVEENGDLVALAQATKPSRLLLSDLRRNVGGFSKVTKPTRIQSSRAAGWRMPTNTVYAGRPTKWANPFLIDQEFVRPKMTPGGGQISGFVKDREHAVHLFRRFTARETAFQIAVGQELRGKHLACWCPLDHPCHADVLLEVANG